MRCAFLIAFSLLLSSCSEDPNLPANELFIEAQEEIAKSTKAKNSQKTRHLQSALELIDQIVKEHPGSELAVKISSEQNIGTFSRSTLIKKLASQDISRIKEAALPLMLESDSTEDEMANAILKIENLMEGFVQKFPSHELSKEYNSDKVISGYGLEGLNRPDIQRTSKQIRAKNKT